MYRDNCYDKIRTFLRIVVSFGVVVGNSSLGKSDSHTSHWIVRMDRPDKLLKRENDGGGDKMKDYGVLHIRWYMGVEAAYIPYSPV